MLAMCLERCWVCGEPLEGGLTTCVACYQESETCAVVDLETVKSVRTRLELEDVEGAPETPALNAS